MKQLFLILLLFLFGRMISAQNSTSGNLDSIIHYSAIKINSPQSGKDLNYQYVFSYNNNGLVSEKIRVKKQNNRFQYESRIQYLYNARNLRSQEIHSTRDIYANLWIKTKRIDLNYDQDLLSEMVEFTWNDTIKTWHKKLKKEFLFATNNQYQSILISEFEDASESWKPRKKTEYSYQSNQTETTQFMYGGDNPDWMPIEKQIVEFEANRPIETILFNYNLANQSWDSISKTNYEYYNGNLVTQTDYDYLHNAWALTESYKYTYLEDSKPETEIFRRKSLTGKWIEIYKKDLMYAESDHPDKIRFYTWNKFARDWSVSYEYDFNINEQNNVTARTENTWNPETVSLTEKSVMEIGYVDNHPETIANYTKINLANAWKKIGRDEFHYDDQTKINTHTYSTFSSKQNEYNPQWTVEYTLDTQGNTSKEVHFEYPENSAQEKSRTSYQYNSQNNPETSINEIHNGQNWINTTQTEIVYDNQIPVTVFVKTWNESLSRWENHTRFSYSFSGSQISGVTNSVWNTAQSVWEDSMKTNIFYNAGQETDSILKYLYKDGDWAAVEKQIYYPNSAGSSFEVVTQYNEGNVWQNSMRRTYFYDENDQTILTRSYYWNPADSSWTKAITNHFSYSEKGNLWSWKQSTGFSYNAEEKPVSLSKYFYENDTPTLSHHPAYARLSVYPNPASRFLKINADNSEAGNGVEIFNLNGELLLKQNLLNGEVDISSLVTGMYILKLNSGNRVLKGKFVKE